VVYHDREVFGRIPQSSREAFLEGIWDTTELLRSNRSRIDRVARDLPYVDR